MDESFTQSFDARDWAKAFCARHPGSDEDDMIGWFANALMRGFDEADKRARSEAPADLRERVSEIVRGVTSSGELSQIVKDAAARICRLFPDAGLREAAAFLVDAVERLNKMPPSDPEGRLKRWKEVFHESDRVRAALAPSPLPEPGVVGSGGYPIPLIETSSRPKPLTGTAVPPPASEPTRYVPGGTTGRYEPGTHVMVMAAVYEAALAALEKMQEAMMGVAPHTLDLVPCFCGITKHNPKNMNCVCARAALTECRKVRGE